MSAEVAPNGSRHGLALIDVDTRCLALHRPSGSCVTPIESPWLKDQGDKDGVSIPTKSEAKCLFEDEDPLIEIYYLPTQCNDAYIRLGRQRGGRR